MHHLTTIALFASLSNALAVNKEATTTISHGRQTSQESLDRCEAAANCEIYDDDFWGKAIRFKEGMGPGTEAHKLMKARSAVQRDSTEEDLVYKRDGAHSIATTSDTSINFGSTGASGTYGLFHKLYDVCHEGGCESNPIYLSSTYASDTSEYQQDLALYARGSYDGWDQRTVFIEAIKAVAGTNEQCEDKTWYAVTGGGQVGGAVIDGTVRECRQTYYIQVDRWESDGGYGGGISATAQEVQNENGWCQFLNIVSQAASILGAVPGSGYISSGADFFGAITGSGC
ncbi:hypothetical protein WHR41_02968 [Cladosporium halotolerans]|uniref:Uncharacterized protein n=1 Tax=Cladosporium halotolerans TaxID=1052096 RepID=A0AB34KYM3_9PEZI